MHYNTFRAEKGMGSPLMHIPGAIDPFDESKPNEDKDSYNRTQGIEYEFERDINKSPYNQYDSA